MAKRFDPDRHNRRSIRLPAYDYRRRGVYFVTICVYQRMPLFGTISDGVVSLGPHGLIVVEELQRMTTHRPNVRLDALVVMPDHVHMIVWIVEPATLASVLHDGDVSILHRSGPTPNSLSAIVGSFKSAVTRNINRLRATPGTPVWQEDFFERIIRTADELERTRRYILANPTRRVDSM